MKKLIYVTEKTAPSKKAEEKDSGHRTKTFDTFPILIKKHDRLTERSSLKVEPKINLLRAII